MTSSSSVATFLPSNTVQPTTNAGSSMRNASVFFIACLSVSHLKFITVHVCRLTTFTRKFVSRTFQRVFLAQGSEPYVNDFKTLGSCVSVYIPPGNIPA